MSRQSIEHMVLASTSNWEEDKSQREVFEHPDELYRLIWHLVRGPKSWCSVWAQTRGVWTLSTQSEVEGKPLELGIPEGFDAAV